MRQFHVRTSRKPRPLPSGHWATTQRWNDLLFAHWPIPVAQMSLLLPEWLHADTFEGSAWLGIVPFWLDRIKIRHLPQVPGIYRFPDLHVRTYVRDRFTGSPGIYSFSMDSSSLFAVGIAHYFFRLPYHWSEMSCSQRSEREFSFYSRRFFAPRTTIFSVRYRGLGPTTRLVEHSAGSFEYFITERNCLFSTDRAGQPVRANLHYVPWPLEEAQAEIERNDLASSIGLRLPSMPPVLHYSRRLAVYVWPRQLLRSSLAARPVAAAVAPSA
jgi:uncharacterized protein